MGAHLRGYICLLGNLSSPKNNYRNVGLYKLLCIDLPITLPIGLEETAIIFK